MKIRSRRLNESKAVRIVKDMMRMALNEQYGVDFNDTLRWVMKRFPNMTQKEQEKFATNIISKKHNESEPKPEFNTTKEILLYHGIKKLLFYPYDVPEYDRSGLDERYIGFATIPSWVKNPQELVNDMNEILSKRNRPIVMFGREVSEFVLMDNNEILALEDL